MSNTQSKTDFVDEPLILPFTPGETLVRLSQVRGALPPTQASFAERLESARTDLLSAFESGAPDVIRSSFQAAQRILTEACMVMESDDATLKALGFPSPAQRADAFALQAPDPASVLATFALNGKQVVTSLSFNRSAGATAYWLHVIRYWEENGETQRIEDPILESYAPLFSRVRLPIGPQILRIKARNASTSAICDEFEVVVPDLNSV